MGERDGTLLFGSHFCFGLKEDAFGERVTSGDIDSTIVWWAGWFDDFKDLGRL